MDEHSIKLLRLALYEIKIENDDAQYSLLGNKIFDLQIQGPHFIQLKSVLQRNIKKKIMGLEARDFSNRQVQVATIEHFHDIETRGAPSIAYVRPVSDENQKKILKKVLESIDGGEFKKNCAPLINFYKDITRYPKGVVGVVQFEITLSPRRIETFLAILITDYSPDTLTCDELSALKYLERTFKHTFRGTILYPHIINREFKGKQPGTKSTFLKTSDDSHVKVHTTDRDESIFSMVGATAPKDPQREIEKIYKEKAQTLKHLKDIQEHSKVNDRKSAKVAIKIDDSVKLFVDLETFLEKYDLCIANGFQGILIKDAKIEVFLGDKNLLNERKINFKTVDEILKNDSK